MSVDPVKYATATAAGTHVRLKMPKAGSADYATGSDWTPASGDVKISIDSGAEANITALPTYSNGWWVFTLTAAETTGKSIGVSIVDAATKAVDDNAVIVRTYGNASAYYAVDFSSSLSFITGIGGQVPLFLPQGTIQAGSTNAVVILAGASLSLGPNSYVGQRLLHKNTGTDRQVASQSISGSNITFTMGVGTGVSGPFNGTYGTAGDNNLHDGDLVWVIPG